MQPECRQIADRKRTSRSSAFASMPMRPAAGPRPGPRRTSFPRCNVPTFGEGVVPPQCGDSRWIRVGESASAGSARARLHAPTRIAGMPCRAGRHCVRLAIHFGSGGDDVVGRLHRRALVRPGNADVGEIGAIVGRRLRPRSACSWPGIVTILWSITNCRSCGELRARALHRAASRLVGTHPSTQAASADLWREGRAGLRREPR